MRASLQDKTDEIDKLPMRVMMANGNEVSGRLTNGNEAGNNTVVRGSVLSARLGSATVAHDALAESLCSIPPREIVDRYG